MLAALSSPFSLSNKKGHNILTETRVTKKMNCIRFLMAILLLLFMTVIPVQAADIVLLFDASGSMRDHPLDGSQTSKVILARQGVDTFLSALSSEDDRVALIVFYSCNDIRVEVDFTRDKDQIRRKLSSVQPTSGTPIAKALEMGWTYLKQNGRKCEECNCPKWGIVLFTDGEETCSGNGCSVASNIARETQQYSETQVYVIAYDMPTDSDPYTSRNDLKCIAQSTGGTYTSCPTSVDLNMAFKQAAKKISTGVTGIIPATGQNTTTVSITNLTGTGFCGMPTVKLTKSGQSSIMATDVEVIDPNHITCTFDLTGKTVGVWDVTVINPDGQESSRMEGFSITNITSAPILFTNENASVSLENMISIAITGIVLIVSALIALIIGWK